jgi:hypothetical protein
MNAQLISTRPYDKTNVSTSDAFTFDAKFSKVNCVQAVWTSTTLSGSLLLRHSVDGINFQSFVTATVISNTSGNAFWNPLGVVGTTYSYLEATFWRVSITVTSGSFDSLKIYFGNISR